MATSETLQPARNMHAADILEQAGCITRFLADISALLHDEGKHSGSLSEKSACGLYYILDDLHNRIELAVSKM